MGRVNYGRFQTLINDTRSSITDAELFCSKALAMHLEKIARAQTRRYGYKRRISVVPFWAPESKYTASTDDNIIHINCGCEVITSLKSRIDRYRAVYGMFAHELGHILYTDFLSMQTYQLRMQAGTWYPRDPRTKSMALLRHMADLEAYCAESDVHRALYVKLSMTLFNIMEDGYVDDRMQQQYSGALGQNLQFLNRTAWAWMPSLTQLVENEADERYLWGSVMQLIIEYCRFGDLVYGDADASDQRVQLLFSLIPLLDRGMRAQKTKDRFAAVNEIAIRCWPHIKDYLDAQEERMQQLAQDAGQVAEEMNDGLCGSSGIGKGTHAPAAGKQQAGSSGAGPVSASRKQAAVQIKQAIQNAAAQSGEPEEQEAQAGDGSDAAGNEEGTGQEQPAAAPEAQADDGDTENTANPSTDGNADEEAADNGKAPADHDDGQSDAATGGEAGTDVQEEPQAGDGTEGQETDESDDPVPDEAGAGADGGDAFEQGDVSTGMMAILPAGAQAVTAEEQGRLPYQDTNAICSTGSGSLIRDDDYQGSGYREAADDIERMLTNMAEVRAEEFRTAELGEQLEAIAYNDVHKDVDKRIHRMAEVDAELIEQYDRVAPPLLQISRRLQKSIERQIQHRRKGGKQTGLYVGRRLNVPALPRNDGRVFYKSSLPIEKSTLAVALLLDESGSMCSCDRATYARATAIILQDFCAALHIPIMIYGHTTEWEYENGVDLFSYAEFDAIDRMDKYRLMDISARGANRDGCALQYVAEQLSRRPEDAKLLILVSDGQPNDWGYEGAAAEEDLQNIKESCRKRRIHLIAAAIGNDKPQIERIYGDSFLDITNLEELPVRLTVMVKRFLRL